MGADLLTETEFHQIENALKQLMGVKEGSDRNAIVQGIKALDIAINKNLRQDE